MLNDTASNTVALNSNCLLLFAQYHFMLSQKSGNFSWHFLEQTLYEHKNNFTDQLDFVHNLKVSIFKLSLCSESCWKLVCKKKVYVKKY